MRNMLLARCSFILACFFAQQDTFANVFSKAQYTIYQCNFNIYGATNVDYRLVPFGYLPISDGMGMQVIVPLKSLAFPELIIKGSGEVYVGEDAKSFYESAPQDARDSCTPTPHPAQYGQVADGAGSSMLLQPNYGYGNAILLYSMTDTFSDLHSTKAFSARSDISFADWETAPSVLLKDVNEDGLDDIVFLGNGAVRGVRLAVVGDGGEVLYQNFTDVDLTVIQIWKNFLLSLKGSDVNKRLNYIYPESRGEYVGLLSGNSTLLSKFASISTEFYISDVRNDDGATTVKAFYVMDDGVSRHLGEALFERRKGWFYLISF